MVRPSSWTTSNSPGRGYRRGVPLQLLAQRRSVTEIRDVEVDRLPSGRHIVRLRLLPFQEFAIEFDGLSIAESPLMSAAPSVLASSSSAVRAIRSRWVSSARLEQAVLTRPFARQ